MDKYAVILASGQGKRMNSKTPKQFLLLENIPIFIYSAKRFFDALPDIKLIISFPPNELKQGKEIAKQFFPEKNITFVEGGATRFHSVFNSLRSVPDNALVAIHDGVRPFVKKKTIHDAFQLALKSGNAIPVIPPSDSIRKISNNANTSVDRSTIRLVQTPQTFLAKKIKPAYEYSHNYLAKKNFTDDASVYEFFFKNETLSLFQGSDYNIKITTPLDLSISNVLLSSFSF